MNARLIKEILLHFIIKFKFYVKILRINYVYELG